MSNFDNSVPPLPGEDWERFISYARGDHDSELSGNTGQLNGVNMDALTPYKPAPQILPDTREGFDENGDFHTQDYDASRRDEIRCRPPLWYYTYTIHERLNREQRELFESGHGYLFTDDDRAVGAAEMVREVIERNGLSEELGAIILNEYRRQFIWEDE